MRGLATLLRKYWALSFVFLAAATWYVTLTVANIPSVDTLSKYHLSQLQAHLLLLTIAVPYVLIWMVGLIGFLKLHVYTKFLKAGKDARGFKTLMAGVFMLTVWLPFSTLLSTTSANYYAHHAAATAWLVRFDNYANIVFLLVAFYLVHLGSTRLLAITRVKRGGMSHRQTALYVIFAALYVFVVFNDSVRQVAATDTTTATYYLSDWWILLTIVIPRLYMWFLGFSAAANMILYRQEVKGAIYRDALRLLALGITGIVGTTVLLRIVQSLSTTLNELSLTLLLLLLYLLLTIIAGGYVLLAKGAERLRKIEES